MNENSTIESTLRAQLVDVEIPSFLHMLFCCCCFCFCSMNRWDSRWTGIYYDNGYNKYAICNKELSVSPHFNSQRFNMMREQLRHVYIRFVEIRCHRRCRRWSTIGVNLLNRQLNQLNLDYQVLHAWFPFRFISSRHVNWNIQISMWYDMYGVKWSSDRQTNRLILIFRHQYCVHSIQIS